MTPPRNRLEKNENEGKHERGAKKGKRSRNYRER